MRHCSLLKDETEILAQAASWRELQKEKGNVPFTDFDWVWAWWQSTGKAEGASLLIVTCQEDQKLVGLLSLAISKKLGVRLLRFAGHDVFYFRHLLAQTPDILKDMWVHVIKNAPFDLAHIKNIHEGTPESTVFEKLWRDDESKPIYYRAHDQGGPETALTPYTKRFRRKLQRIEDAISNQGGFTLTFTETSKEINEATFFLVEKKREWCEATGKRGIFKSPWVYNFYQAVISLAKDQGSLRLLTLKKKEDLVAVLFCIQYKDTLYAHTVAYDPAFLHICPGLFLKKKAIEWAHTNGLVETNFMEGQESFKLRFATNTRQACGYLYPRTIKGWIFAMAYKIKQNIKHIHENGAHG